MKPEWAACSCECRKCWRSRPPEGLRAPSERRLLLQQPLRTCLTAVLPYRTSCLAQLVSAPRARSLTRAHDYRTSCLAQLRSAGTGSTTTKCLFTHHRTKSLAQSPTACPSVTAVTECQSGTFAHRGADSSHFPTGARERNRSTELPCQIVRSDLRPRIILRGDRASIWFLEAC